MKKKTSNLTISIFLVATRAVVPEASSLPAFVETKITASSPLERVAFGVGTAIGPRIAVVGSLGASQPYGPGEAHILLDNSPTANWSDLTRRVLSASDGASQDYFGFQIALEERTIVVSAHGLDDSSGAVYVFMDTSIAGDWSSISERKVVPSDVAVGDNFGISLDIDGSVLVVGAYFDDPTDDEIDNKSGSVYIFRDTSGSGDWSTYEETKFLSSDIAPGDRFGSAVDLHGRVLLIGASGIGKAYLLQDTSFGNDWSSIIETVIDPTDSGQGYGITAALSGPVAAIGDSLRRCVHLLLDTSGDGSWSSFDEQEIRPFDWATFAQSFGFTMALSENFLTVGAHHDEELATQAGAVYVYQDTSQASDWSVFSETKFTPSDLEGFDRFGRGLAASAESWIAGATNDDDAGDNTGAAYIFSFKSDSIFLDGFELGDTTAWSETWPSPCSHDPCEIGAALNSQCDPCVTQICEVDDFCCSGLWDRSCVDQVATVCGQICHSCDHSFCETGIALDPQCHSCVEQICLVDDFCCTTLWDRDCVDQVPTTCGLTCD